VVTGSVRTLLRLEGAVIFVFAVGLYLRYGGSAWLLIPLLLAVDVSMAGYLANARLGALTYNALHSWAPGFVVLGLGLVSGYDGAVVAGAVLVAHVGMDRMLGYGLKYPTAFGDTHLGRIGRSR
jgi:hypothetical protein